MSTPVTTTENQGAPIAPKQSNGFAVAALIFGIIGGALLGLIFGFIGLARAKKVGGTGRAMSWIGIILSILWIAGVAAVAVTVGPKLIKAADPGCVQAKDVIHTSSQNKTTDLASFKADAETVISGLNSAASKSNSNEAATAIRNLAKDYQELLTSVSRGESPSSSLESRLDADASAVDKACGTIGT